MDYEHQRRGLVEELAGEGIRDSAVLEAIANVPRHRFVPEEIRGRAYMNSALPIGDGQTISQPWMVARMTELLDLGGEEKVLEIGTGSGYQAAVLARLASRVFTIERIETLARRARKVLDELNIFNVNIRVGDGCLGWSRYQPYDRIIVTAASTEPPRVLLDQLANGGRMVMPVGEPEDALLTVITRSESGLTRRSFGRCRFVPLIGKEETRG